MAEREAKKKREKRARNAAAVRANIYERERYAQTLARKFSRSLSTLLVCSLVFISKDCLKPVKITHKE